MRLSEKVATLRKAKGLTQVQLGELAGVTGTYICEIEQGNRTPSLRVVKRLAEAFEVSLPCFFATSVSTESGNVEVQ